MSAKSTTPERAGAEGKSLAEARERDVPWKKWGSLS